MFFLRSLLKDYSLQPFANNLSLLKNILTIILPLAISKTKTNIMMKKISLFLFLIQISLLINAQIPEAFDLRDYDDENFVTSVKSQDGGTCWTHGTMASIESNLLVTEAWSNNGETGEPNLAEYHLDWWNGYNQHNNDDLDPPTGSGLEVHMGGDYLVSTAYLSRLEGAVRDIDGQSYTNPPIRWDENYNYYYPRNVEWFTIDDELNGIDEIKQRLMDEGAIATCMCYDYSFIDYSYNHYQPSNSSYLPNHSVTIIGWDDNHDVPAAPQAGAWLVKNSWGTGWGYDGYFWISYYDKWSCKEWEMGAVSFIDVEPLQYEHVYYHDYHGWRDTKEDITEAYNAFLSRENTVLTSVSFFTATDDVDFKIKVFRTSVEDSICHALSIHEGNVARRGFHTIDLDLPVQLRDEMNFYIYLYLSEGGHPYDRTSLVPVLLNDTILKTSKDEPILVESTAAEGESFYYENDQWNDFYFYDDPSSYDGTGNFCIKGLAKDVDLNEFGAVFHILKSHNNLGIQGASVTFNGETQIADKQGDVQFLNFPENSDDIPLSISADGYLQFDTTISIVDSTVILDIKLESLVAIAETKISAHLYPNPADDYLMIEGITNNFSYNIFDLTGKLVSQGISDEKVSVSELEKGFYLIEIDSEGQKQTLKFIKR